MEKRFLGSLLGLCVGDALGSFFEGQDRDWIRSRFRSRDDFVARVPQPSWRYTDDTQMMIGVAEALASDGEIDEETLCRKFADNYDPSRGYGSGARQVLQAMQDGGNYRQLTENWFPGGSYGNGAAMRVAPVGLLFHDDDSALMEQARLSSLPTHIHPLGIEGAQLVAAATGWATRSVEFDRDQLLSHLVSLSTADEYRSRLSQLADAETIDDLIPLGNGIAAMESAVTAIGCFLMNARDFEAVVSEAILLGGDTDTIAAMAAGISGAFLGVEAIPGAWLNSVEDSAKGRSYIAELARELCGKHESLQH